MAHSLAEAPCELLGAFGDLAEACDQVSFRCEVCSPPVPVRLACQCLREKCTRLESVIQEHLSRLKNVEKGAYWKKIVDEERQEVEQLIRRKSESEVMPMSKRIRPASERPSVELHGNFIAVCRCLHMILQSIVEVDLEGEHEWEEFCQVLSDEGMSLDRWSQPVHSQLAEALRMTGFSQDDWDLSLPHKNGMVTYSPQVTLDEASRFKELPDLTPAQMDLEERIRDYHREDMKKFLGV